jgi:tetratricopeptide (TPR) repeat protein
MTCTARRQFVVLTAAAVLLGQAGCAARGGAAVGEADRNACEALARVEAEVVRRHAASPRGAERESFERRAEARLSEAASLGYLSTSIGGVTVGADARWLTEPIALLTVIVEAAVWPIRSTAESLRRQQIAHEAAMTDCATAMTAADRPELESHEVAKALHRLGRRYLSQGRYAEAERLYRRALAIRGNDLFATHAAVAESLQGLVASYRARGQYAEAEQLQAWMRQPRGGQQQTPVQQPPVQTASTDPKLR